MAADPWSLRNTTERADQDGSRRAARWSAIMGAKRGNRRLPHQLA